MLIAPAGILSYEQLSKVASSLKTIIWVVESTSRQMDWNESAPKGTITATWHTLVEDAKDSADDSLHSLEFEAGPPNVISIWPLGDPGLYELVEFTQKVGRDQLSVEEIKTKCLLRIS